MNTVYRYFSKEICSASLSAPIASIIIASTILHITSIIRTHHWCAIVSSGLSSWTHWRLARHHGIRHISTVWHLAHLHLIGANHVHSLVIAWHVCIFVEFLEGHVETLWYWTDLMVEVFASLLDEFKGFGLSVRLHLELNEVKKRMWLPITRKANSFVSKKLLSNNIS